MEIVAKSYLLVQLVIVSTNSIKRDEMNLLKRSSQDSTTEKNSKPSMGSTIKCCPLFCENFYMILMTKKYVFFIMFALCTALGILFLLSWCLSSRKPNLTHAERLQYYPILQRTGNTLPELLKLDVIEEVWLMCTRDPKYTLSCYVTNKAETKVAEESLKRLFSESESFTLRTRDNHKGDWTKYEVKDSSFNARLAEAVHFESYIVLFVGVGAGIPDKMMELQPNGLRIILYSRDYMRLVDSYAGYTCDMQVNPEFFDLLDKAFKP